MSDFTDFTESEVVSWMVGGSDMPAAHTDVYVALHSSDPTDSGDSNELSAASYDRVQTAAGTDWNISGNAADNANEILFPEAQEDWGTVTHVSLWDGVDSTYNSLGYSALDSSVTINTNDQLRFPAGELSITID